MFLLKFHHLFVLLATLLVTALDLADGQIHGLIADWALIHLALYTVLIFRLEELGVIEPDFFKLGSFRHIIP